MHSQLSAYPLALLPKQYLKLPLCRRAQRRLQPAPRITKSLHSLSGCRRHGAPSQAGRCHRQLQAQHKHSAYHGFHTSSVELALQEAPQSFPESQPSDTSLTLSPRDTNGIAILGGGISGLASAFYSTSLWPKNKVTIYEQSDRLEGWLQTKYVNVRDGTVVFQQGPRTLQPHKLSSLVTLKLIKDLGIENEVMFVHKDFPSARNRFIYYPDHLVKMPGGDQGLIETLWSFLAEPLYKGSWKAFVDDIANSGRDKNLTDESISSFFNRRFGRPDITDNIISAVVHGIYAGDVDKLSIKSLFRTLWEVEGDYETVFGGLMMKQIEEKKTRREQRDDYMRRFFEHGLKGPFADKMQNARAYSFKQGISTLSHALEEHLKSCPNVEFKINEKVTHVDYDAEIDGIQITTDRNHPPMAYKNCISTVPASALATLTPHLPALKGIHSVTVMVVNLFYRSPDLIHEQGFGYLIPRSIPFSQNPECALGVVFDSAIRAGKDTVPGTKITVIIGGHYWDCLSQYPDEEEGARMAKNILKRHLGIDEEPEAVLVGLNKNCIPQYYVGHNQKMMTTDDDLQTKFNTRLSVAGSSYNGVGVNDCVMNAFEVTRKLFLPKRLTGLEQYRNPPYWDLLG